ncbi:MAG TPA: DNA polymerase III subunit delta' [Gammaproteobacteria bacterium]|nr:DNA polymerase III subunit delta' [Gammaproteobacteria bacterium]
MTETVTAVDGWLPWHRPAAQRLADQLAADRVPHALLLPGPEGTGKTLFGESLARLLLCRSPQAGLIPCGSCRDCRLVTGAVHPDLVRVLPENPDRPVIKVDQVRRLTEFLSLSSQYGGRRIALVDPADALNTNAANSLLKTLEEPPAAVTIILITSRPGALPATIRSRCQIVRLPPATRAQASEWLAGHAPQAQPLLGLANGAPLTAVRLAEEDVETLRLALIEDLVAAAGGRLGPPEAAAHWQSTGARRVASLVQSLVTAGLRARLGKATAPDSRFSALFDRLSVRLLYDYLDTVTDLRRALEQPLNETLALESLFSAWIRVQSTGNENNG